MIQITLPNRGLTTSVDIGHSADYGADWYGDHDEDFPQTLQVGPSAFQTNVIERVPRTKQDAMSLVEAQVAKLHDQLGRPLYPDEVAAAAMSVAQIAKGEGLNIDAFADDFARSYAATLREFPSLFADAAVSSVAVHDAAQAKSVAAASKIREKAAKSARRKEVTRQVVRTAAVGIPIWGILSAL